MVLEDEIWRFTQKNFLNNIYKIHKDKSNMRLYYSLNWKMLNIKGRSELK